LGELPSGDSFYSGHDITLPTPAEIRIAASNQNIDITRNYRPDPVRFPERRLIVKWGQHVTSAEAQCMWFIGKHLSPQVPVPQVYGWTRDGAETFLYLELIDGHSLAERWDGLTDEEKSQICRQLRAMIFQWRRIRQPQAALKLSHIGGQGLCDYLFEDGGIYPAGPFLDTASFHDTFARLSIPSRPASKNCLYPRQECEELRGLSDDVDVVFTHADLDLSNILISKPGEGPVRVVAVIDWHQSGWYPEPWEKLKAYCVAWKDTDWAEKYLDTVLPPVRYEYAYSWEYVQMAMI
jgi:aminoglycoside phosphotransferase (APT) family kinase protein